MAGQSVELAKQFFSAHEGSDVLAIQRDWVERFGPNPHRETVVRLWADDPGWRHVDPDVDWDYTGAGAFGTRERGAAAVYAWWVDWLQGFESYSFEIIEYREAGDWALVPAILRATGRDGLPLELRVFQLVHASEGKIDILRVFFTEAEAMESAGSSQERIDVPGQR